MQFQIERRWSPVVSIVCRKNNKEKRFTERTGILKNTTLQRVHAFVFFGLVLVSRSFNEATRSPPVFPGSKFVMKPTYFKVYNIITYLGNLDRNATYLTVPTEITQVGGCSPRFLKWSAIIILTSYKSKGNDQSPQQMITSTMALSTSSLYTVGYSVPAGILK